MRKFAPTSTPTTSAPHVRDSFSCGSTFRWPSSDKNAFRCSRSNAHDGVAIAILATPQREYYLIAWAYSKAIEDIQRKYVPVNCSVGNKGSADIRVVAAPTDPSPEVSQAVGFSKWKAVHELRMVASTFRKGISLTSHDFFQQTDFWGPVSNFGIPVAAVMDTQKSPELYVITYLPRHLTISCAFPWVLCAGKHECALLTSEQHEK